MNTVSTLLYAADVVGNLSGLSTAVFVFATVIGGGTVLVKFVTTMSGDEKAARAICLPSWWWRMVFVFAFLTVATPSRNTIHLIAASEFAGAVMQGETATRIGSKLEQALDKLLEVRP